MVDIEEARDKISYGRERRRVMDVADLRNTAYHEAGHAVVQALIDDGALPLSADLNNATKEFKLNWYMFDSARRSRVRKNIFDPCSAIGRYAFRCSSSDS